MTGTFDSKLFVESSFELAKYPKSECGGRVGRVGRG
jgi:hypothetical protein